jgi:hypothetical protein
MCMVHGRESRELDREMGHETDLAMLLTRAPGEVCSAPTLSSAPMGK